jgi:hypothetical protein
MAKPVRISQNLVLLHLGYWGKYVLPVRTATEIMALMIESGAVKVEEDQGAYIPTRMDAQVSPLDKPFIDDVPTDGKGRDEYKAWVKTKRGIIGDGYCPETYAAFLEAKED